MEQSRTMQDVLRQADLFETRSCVDNIHGTILYSGLEKFVMGSPLMQRLQRVSQNSLVFMTFPSNKTKRYEHSVGVMHLAGEMFASAIANTSSSLNKVVKNAVLKVLESANQQTLRDYDLKGSFNNYAAGKINDFYLKEIGIFEYADKTKVIPSTFYARTLPANVVSSQSNTSNLITGYLFAALYQGLRLAALLHDVGHLPYSHTVEKVLSELITEVNKKDDKNKIEQRFCSLMTSLKESAPENHCAWHELIGYKLIDEVEKDVIVAIKDAYDTDKMHDIADSKHEYKMPFVFHSFEIAKRILFRRNGDECTIYDIFHNFISGIIDADRLDYTSRDLVNSGLTGGALLYKRIIHNLLLYKEKKDENDPTSKRKILLSLLAKSAADAEEALNRRWRVYEQIIFHHEVRRNELFMRNILRKMAKITFESEKLTYTHDECRKGALIVPIEGNFMMSIMTFIEELVAPDSRRETVDEKKRESNINEYFQQLNDSWLDTSLRYYKMLYPPAEKYDEDMLNVLVANGDKYTTLIKRQDDFWSFDQQLFEYIFLNKEKSLREIENETLQSKWHILERLINTAESELSHMSAKEKSDFKKKVKRCRSILDTFIFLKQESDDFKAPKYEEWNMKNDVRVRQLFNELLREFFVDNDKNGKWIDDFNEFMSNHIEYKDFANNLVIGNIYVSRGISCGRERDEDGEIVADPTTLLLVRRRDPDNPRRFTDISALESILTAKRAVLPAFHLYYSGKVKPEQIYAALNDFVLNNMLAIKLNEKIILLNDLIKNKSKSKGTTPPLTSGNDSNY